MIRSCPAGQYYVQPVPMSDTGLPTGTAYPTQFTDAHQRLAPTDASAAAAVEAVTLAHRARAVLGHVSLLARNSAERRFRDVVSELLREGFGYDWQRVLAPLAVGGGDRFVSERAYMQARFGSYRQAHCDGYKALAAEQTGMRERLSCLLCWAHALAGAEPALDGREAAAMTQATLALLADAAQRLDVSGSGWARTQAKAVRALRVALEPRAPAPKRAPTTMPGPAVVAASPSLGAPRPQEAPSI